MYDFGLDRSCLAGHLNSIAPSVHILIRRFLRAGLVMSISARVADTCIFLTLMGCVLSQMACPCCLCKSRSFMTSKLELVNRTYSTQ